MITLPFVFSSEEELLQEAENLRRRSASVLEVKEHAHTRLREELLNAQKVVRIMYSFIKKDVAT